MHPNSYLLLLLVLLICGGLLWIGLAAIMAWSILRPPRMSAGKAIYHLRRLSPGDLNLRFEEQNFQVCDARTQKKLNISAWWIPAATPSQRCIVLVQGYADAKVGSIGWAPLLHDLNFNVLAIDLRAHGDSDGHFCTGGYFERNDVSQIVDQLLLLYPLQTKDLILFGISLGAAVACAVAANRDDITALILESPFTDYKKAITAHTRLMRLPGGLLLRTAIAGAQWLSGAKFDDVRLKDNLPKTKCPVLTIVGTQDELLDAEDYAILERSTLLNPASVYWLVKDAGHLQAMVLDPIEYERRLKLFSTP